MKRAAVETQCEDEESEGGQSHNTDYSRCIICQKEKTQKLYNVTQSGLHNLMTAAEARQDEPAVRLKHDIGLLTFLQEKTPRWHADCRNVYTLKKSYELAKKRRIGQYSTSASTSSSSNECTTRSSLPKVNFKSQCVICNKVYDRHGKQPKSLVATDTRQRTLLKKAKALNDQALLHRIQGYSNEAIDMVAYDVCYHIPCMNRYLAQREKYHSTADVCMPSDDCVEQTQPNDISSPYDIAFRSLLEIIHKSLFIDLVGYLLSNLRDIYREELRKAGIEVVTYKSRSLKMRLQKHYGDMIVFMPQTNGSDFVCSSTLNIGDALKKLSILQEECEIPEDERILQVAQILRSKAKEYNNTCKYDSFNISSEAARESVPEIIYNFACQLLVDKKLTQCEDRTVECSDDIRQKALILSQQLLYAICSARSPLTVGMAYDVYNNSRSKTLMTLLNKVNLSISYDTFHRELSGLYTDIHKGIMRNGLYLPPNMKHQVFTQFAIDNIDWNEKTTDGTTYHATSMIMIQPPSDNTNLRSTLRDHKRTTTSREKSISQMPVTEIEPCHLSSSERKKSRSLSGISSVASLQSEGTNKIENLLFLWTMCRMAPTKLLDFDGNHEKDRMPSFSAFSASIVPDKKANTIGYLPLISSSPTDPAVVKKAMIQCVNLAEHVGSEFTIVSCDLAVYEIAFALREQNPDQLSSVVLQLGGFHLCHNFMKAITKIMRGSGIEDLLVHSGIAREGTAHKIFGEKGDYYQTLYALKLLYEIMYCLLWDAFEEWSIEEVKDVRCLDSIRDVMKNAYDTISSRNETNSTLADPAFEEILINAEDDIMHIQVLFREFCEANEDRPTFVYWNTFLDMVKILFRFIYSQREGLWLDYLTEAGRMLPYIVAAGHHKYGTWLPLYLREMKNLKTTHPTVYTRYIEHGDFTVRRANGRHNGVSPDMILEQTYNADLKHKQGLSGITLNKRAQSKWLYTKPVTAAMSGCFREMLQLHPGRESLHHEAGLSQTNKDNNLVANALKAISKRFTDPFKTQTAMLINIATGEQASSEVCENLTHIKEIGETTLQKGLESGGQKVSVVKLKTFASQYQKHSQLKVHQVKTPEVNVLHRLSQVIAAGATVDIHEMIGRHECTENPPSLFDPNGTLRRGVKSTLVKVLLEETQTETNKCLPDNEISTAVIVDAMHMVRKWSFHCNENFNDVQARYQHNLILDTPVNTGSVHFICDRYDCEPSLKAMERQHRTSTKYQKIFEVDAHIPTPPFKDFVQHSQNKARLLEFLCMSWSKCRNLGNVKLFLSGGFSDKTATLQVDQDGSHNIVELESNHEEADTRLILHILYSFENMKTERVVVHSNDTDVIVMCIYFASKYNSFKELWVRVAEDEYLPVHKIAEKLGPTDSRFLPFFHALTGKDDTSFVYGLGKRKLWKAHKGLDCHYMSEFADHLSGQFEMPQVPELLERQATKLILRGYAGGENCTSLAECRTRKFLSGSGVLQSLPPTADSFSQHVRRAALSTILMKSAHIPLIPRIPYEWYGWSVTRSDLAPVKTTREAFPKLLEHSTKCSCKKKCVGNCSCHKNNVTCYIACSCECVKDKYSDYEPHIISSDDEEDGN